MGVRCFNFLYFLPIVANVILLLLEDKADPMEKALKELRKELRIEGTVEDNVFPNVAAKALVNQAKSSIRFEVEVSPIGDYQTVNIWINGQALLDSIHSIEKQYVNEPTPSFGAYEGLPTTALAFPSLHLLGTSAAGYGYSPDKTILMVCSKTGDPLKSAIGVKIVCYRKYIVWQQFENLQYPDRCYKGLGPFVFPRIAYVRAIEALQLKSSRA